MSGRIPSLDGIRGIAVLAVVAHHLGHLPGGYLGVDAFFCLSGFLITGLLLDEASARSDGRARIALGDFWLRRVHRLLPALMALLVVVVTVERWVVERSASPTAIRDETLAALAYVSNWRELAAGTDYWDQFTAPSPLRHLWSLAIEEQFYLVWPLVVVAVLWSVGGRATPRRVAVAVGSVAVAIAAASAVVALVLADTSGTARVYYGTDTRAAAIAFGAVGAAAVRVVPPAGVAAQRVLGVLAGVLVVPLVWAWVAVDGESTWLYGGGLLAIGLATTLVIVATTIAPRSVVARAVGWAPLRGVGHVSYGLYLWHWPVIVWLTPGRVGIDGPWLLALRVAVFTTATLVSYRLVEQPVRTSPRRSRRAVAVAAPSILGVGALAMIVVGGAGVSALPAAGTRADAPMPPPRATVVTVATTVPASPADRNVPPAPVPAEEVVQRASEPRVPEPVTPRLMVVGDSGAYFLGALFGEAAPAAEVLPRGEIGCGVANAGGGLWYDNGEFVPDPVDCDTWPRRWADDAVAFDPDITLIVLAWPGYGDRAIGGGRVHPCDAEFDVHYAGRLDLALRSAGAGGGRVAIVTVPPPEPPPGATGLALRLADLAVDRVGCLNREIVAAADRSDATVVDLAGWLCPDAACRSVVDEVARPDGVHFGGRGGVAVAAWIASELGIGSRPETVGASGSRASAAATLCCMPDR